MAELFKALINVLIESNNLGLGVTKIALSASLI